MATLKELRQKEKFNRMLSTLKKIAYQYDNPQRLMKNLERRYGLSGIEALEMAYENIQEEAKYCIKGIRKIK